MNTSTPSWNALYEAAATQSGHVTAQQAAEAGYSPQLLQKYLASGRIIRIRRGIYRLVHFPSSDLEDLVVYWLWSERAGVFSHETALFLHELSDVLPDITTLTVPNAWSRRRLRVPKGLQLRYADIPPTGRTWHGPVPVTTPLRTLYDVRADDVSPEHVERAMQDGLGRGLFSDEEVQSFLAADGSGEP